MSRIGFGYGSEWHLMRYLAYHNRDLSDRIEALIPNSRMVNWLNWGFTQSPDAINKEPPRFLDAELKGLEFLPKHERQGLASAWRSFWPQTGTPPTWDAVGLIECDGIQHWLLVEAKSHLAELRSTCAASGRSLALIEDTFRRTQQDLALMVNPTAWLTPFYQYCNRLTVTHFLHTHDVPIKLVFLYFTGDLFPRNCDVYCPIDREQWQPAIEEVKGHIGWNPHCRLNGHVYDLFVPVCPRDPQNVVKFQPDVGL